MFPSQVIYEIRFWLEQGALGLLNSQVRQANVKVVANRMMETPIYGIAEAAQYLRVPQNTLAYWLKGGGAVPPLIKLAGAEPPRLSFSNLLECYMLSSMRAIYDVQHSQSAQGPQHSGSKSNSSCERVERDTLVRRF
jgi:hypothetical protein